jgi:hypothetical protein
MRNANDCAIDAFSARIFSPLVDTHGGAIAFYAPLSHLVVWANIPPFTWDTKVLYAAMVAVAVWVAQPASLPSLAVDAKST